MGYGPKKKKRFSFAKFMFLVIILGSLFGVGFIATQDIKPPVNPIVKTISHEALEN